MPLLSVESHFISIIRKITKMKEPGNKNPLLSGVIVLGFVLSSVLSGCGPAVEPWEVICESDTCWDISDVDYIYVNDFPKGGNIPPKY